MSFRSVSEAREEAGSAAMKPREDDGEKRRSASRDSDTTQFGVEPYRDGHETVLQRLAQQHGADQVRQWAAEGMPIETMGKTLDMEDFRERQQERPPEVPTDIERQNAKSVQRSKGAHHEPSKAGETQVPDSVRSVISSSGQQLDQSIQRAMEDRMGDNLGDVRIHTGPPAAKACEDINARAFTVGNHIAFNRGEYDPESAEGQHVLAHELAHVRQQTGGAVSMLPQEGELRIDPDEQLEREAEETADRVMRGGMLGVQRMRKADVHVQRMSITDGVSGAVGKAKAKVPGLGNDEDKQYQDLSDGDLAETVGTLVENQREIISTLDAQQSGLLDKTAETASKMGAGAAVMGGAAMMTAKDPGMAVTMGTMVAAAGGKVLAGAGYDRGKAKASDAAAVGKEKLAGVKEIVSDIIDEKVPERLRGSDTGSGIEGKAEGGNV